MSLFRSAAMTDRGQLKSAKARSQKIVSTIEALEAMVADSKFEVQGKGGWLAWGDEAMCVCFCVCASTVMRSSTRVKGLLVNNRERKCDQVPG